MSELEIEGLSVRYGSVDAVRNVSLRCVSGNVVALLGPNGAGKSSTLLGISGSLPVGTVRGKVRIDEQRLDRCSPEVVSRAGVVLVPEGRRIFGSLSVTENLLIGASAWAHGWSGRRDAVTETRRVFERFPALAAARNRAGGLLSGGQQQQLAIARALMARPRFLLLDEPSLGLSPNVIAVILDIVRELRASGMGVILVEQQVVQAMEVSDRAYIMRKGQIEGQADSQDSEMLIRSYLGQSQEAAPAP